MFFPSLIFSLSQKYKNRKNVKQKIRKNASVDAPKQASYRGMPNVRNRENAEQMLVWISDVQILVIRAVRFVRILDVELA